jgi:hypothetical protein
MDRACLLLVKSLKRIMQHSSGPSHYIFAAVFLLRLLVLVRLTSSPFLLPNQGDMHFYNDWALRILRGQLTDHHAFYGLPLYAYLLAGIYKVFGYNPFLPGLVQVCLESGTAILLYKLAVRIFGDEKRLEQKSKLVSFRPKFLQYRGQVIGILAALGWALFQPAEAYSIILMPTSWLVFVFWFVVWQIVKRRTAPGLSGLLFLGVLIGFSAMGVATVLFLIPLLLAALFFKWEPVMESKRAWATRLLRAIVLLLGIGVGISPSWLHNYFIARDPVFLSAHSGVNFWIGNNPRANGYPRFPSGLHAGQEAMLQDSITVAESAAGHPLKRSEVSTRSPRGTGRDVKGFYRAGRGRSRASAQTL